MADSNFTPKKHQQQLLKDQNASKFYTHFLFKALLVTIFCLILNLFTSQAPEFSSQTRILEFLHLIFVGIAVSYGLFSRKTDETGKENSYNHPKFDNAHMYVSRFLQVSSVFDEENENESGTSDEGKVQTWSNRCYRNEPEVIVSKDQSVLGTRSRISDKPLLLPIRSLKSRVSAADSIENIHDLSGKNICSLSRSCSNLGSKRFLRTLSEKSNNGEVRGSNDHLNFPEKNSKKISDIVLPSPIPWGSRSGRMEVKNFKEDVSTSPLNTPKEECSPFKPRASCSLQPNPASSSPNLTPSQSFSSPKKSSPLPSLSSESLGKFEEDFLSKKSFCGACPLPPPPPPPPFFNKTASEKDLPRSYMNDPGQLDETVRESFTRPGGHPVEHLSSMAKFVKMGRSGDPIINQDPVFGNGFKEPSRKNDGSDQETSNKTTKVNNESVSIYLPNKSSTELRKEEISRFAGKRDAKSEDDNVYIDQDLDDDDDDDTGASSLALRILGNSNKEQETESDDGPDVDKKADEFIAKFREQIRLQRIESIKRSATAQMRRNSSS